MVALVKSSLSFFFLHQHVNENFPQLFIARNHFIDHFDIVSKQVELHFEKHSEIEERVATSVEQLE